MNIGNLWRIGTKIFNRTFLTFVNVDNLGRIGTEIFNGTFLTFVNVGNLGCIGTKRGRLDNLMSGSRYFDWLQISLVSWMTSLIFMIGWLTRNSYGEASNPYKCEEKSWTEQHYDLDFSLDDVTLIFACLRILEGWTARQLSRHSWLIEGIYILMFLILLLGQSSPPHFLLSYWAPSWHCSICSWYTRIKKSPTMDYTTRSISLYI